jgi:two-component system, NarL family, response regulator NreC
MSQNNKPIRVLIADDHKLFRKGLRMIFNEEKDIILVGEATDGIELLQMTGGLRPDVVVTDIQMPILNGIEATGKIKNAYPSTEVIGLSFFAEISLINSMIEAGAKGYLEKSVQPEEVLLAIRTVYRQQNYFCKNTMEILSDTKPRPKETKNAAAQLSEREKEIVKLICEECSSQEIAEKLFISPRTVHSHRERIMQKINKSNIAGIIIFALQNGIYSC